MDGRTLSPRARSRPRPSTSPLPSYSALYPGSIRDSPPPAESLATLVGSFQDNSSRGLLDSIHAVDRRLEPGDGLLNSPANRSHEISTANQELHLPLLTAFAGTGEDDRESGSPPGIDDKTCISAAVLVGPLSHLGKGAYRHYLLQFVLLSSTIDVKALFAANHNDAETTPEVENMVVEQGALLAQLAVYFFPTLLPHSSTSSCAAADPLPAERV